METEFLKEPWVFPRTKTNSTMKEEDIAALSAWEEDFQDLSSWCMDPFQGQCDFRIGESTTFKLSGTKYEGNGVLIAKEEELLKDLTRTTDDKKLDLKMDTVKTTKESSDSCHLLLSPSELVNERGLGYNKDENNASSSWLMSPESTASKSTSSSKQHDADTSASLQSKDHDLDYASPIPFDNGASQRDTWDELHTIETTGSNTFDLLSYLWEDEMRTIEGNASTDSSTLLKVRPSATTSSSAPPFTSTKVKTEEINEPTPPPPTRRRMETRATSTMTSSTAKSPVVSSRRSERTRTASTKSKERERAAVINIKANIKNGSKRYYESDSEDDDVALAQYRECREKNNEASRRSRMNKKAKESEMAERATELERDNKILKMKVEELEKLVTSMRNALLRSALKKEF
ncbi:inner centromere protein A [Monomorium pharaonis]|uniref:inner centromere protein A n=1 Tax=Monomorium pharaonis TaxID=307658 RepID=UPI00102E193E|nr:inner centromere protein A [Monomorium pharaonis]